MREIKGLAKENIILSKNNVTPVGYHNILLIGDPNTGKKISFINPNILQMNSSFVVTVQNRDEILAYQDMLKNNGYKVKIFDFYKGLNNSDSYNPIIHLKNETDVLNFAECIMNNALHGGVKDFRRGNEWYAKINKLLIAAALFYVLEFGEEKQKSLEGILNLLNSPGDEECPMPMREENLRMFKILKNCPHDSLTYKYYEKFYNTAKTEKLGIHISEVIRFQIFFTPQIAKLINADTLEIEKMGTEKTAIFIIPDQTRDFNGWSDVIVSSIYSQIMNTYCSSNIKNNIPIHLILNKIDTCGYIPELSFKLSKIKGHNISATIILDDIEIFQEIYLKEWKDITDTCFTKLFFGSCKSTTLKYINSLSYNIFGKFKLKQDIENLNNDECIIFCEDEPPIIDKKYSCKKYGGFYE